MGKLLDLLFGTAPPRETAVAGVAALPLVVTQGPPAPGVDKIAHAKYRLDAIKRTIEQSGDTLSAAHRAEFKAEIRDHAHTLVQAGIIGDEQAAVMVRSGTGVTL